MPIVVPMFSEWGIYSCLSCGIEAYLSSSDPGTCPVCATGKMRMRERISKKRAKTLELKEEISGDTSS